MILSLVAKEGDNGFRGHQIDPTADIALNSARSAKINELFNMNGETSDG